MAARYVNTDLLLRCPDEQPALVAALAGSAVGARDVGRWHGLWQAVLRTNHVYRTSTVSIMKLLDAIERMPPEAKTRWDACTEREFSVEFEVASNETLPPIAFFDHALLTRIVAVGATLTFSIYADRLEAVSGDSGVKPVRPR